MKISSTEQFHFGKLK